MFQHIIRNFRPIAGHHCNTTSLRHIFLHNDYAISEEMLLGLGSGMSFAYIHSKAMGDPFIGGRTGIGVFENNLARCLNISIQVHETSSPKKAYRALKELIAQDIPVMVYVDMPYFPYLRLPAKAHFGGHSIVVFGIDETQGLAYLSDRDDAEHKITMSAKEIPADTHTVTLEQLERARGSKFRPFPPKNRWLTFDFSTIRPTDRQMITAALRVTTGNMLNPPIKNLGVRGIRTCAVKVLEWKNFDDNILKGAALNAYVYITPVGGTGGGSFRKMYGTFLRESGQIIASEELSQIGDEYFAVGEGWDQIGETFYTLFRTLDRRMLPAIAERIRNLGEQEIVLMNRLKTFCEA